LICVQLLGWLLGGGAVEELKRKRTDPERRRWGKEMDDEGKKRQPG
jgi:hypothetical protein